MNKSVLVLLLVLIPSPLFSQNLDIRILRSLSSPQAVPSDKFFQFVSNSNFDIVLGIPAGMAITGLIEHDRKLIRNACVNLTSTIISSGITAAMKYSINRDRPFITYPDIVQKSPAGSPSFPSGHTSIAFSAATSLSLSYPKWYIIVPAFTWAGIVGYSRMHLGVHYPSDVIVGAMVGAGSAWLTHAVNKKLIARSKK
jgi:membrane-associated phospholipid phosphatase